MILTQNRLTAAIVGIMFFTLFVSGASVGSEAVHNESISIDEVDKSVQEVPSKIKRSIKRNATGIGEDFVVSVAMPMARGAVTVSRAGLRFGAAAPGIAGPLNFVSPMIILGMTGWRAYPYVKRIIVEWRRS